MKRREKRLAVLLAACLLLAACAPGASAASAPALRYNADGTFRILVFADAHYSTKKSDLPKMSAFMGEALDYAKPDLVVFLGDNVTDTDEAEAVRKALGELLAPVTQRQLKFAFIFGNHDLTDFAGFDFDDTAARETLLAMYQDIPGCLTAPENPKNPGFSSYHLPIYSGKNAKKLVSNLWFFDSGGYRFENLTFIREFVKQAQVDWYLDASRRLEQENGGKPVPSLAFQHIMVQQLYDRFPQLPVEIPFLTEDILGSYRLVLPDFLEINDRLQGVPQPSRQRDTEFEAWTQRGDIFAAVFGHHHSNGFTVRESGVDLMNIPTVNFSNAYASNINRGAALFTLRESAPRSYIKEDITYHQLAALPGSKIGGANPVGGLFGGLITLLETGVYSMVYFWEGIWD